MKSHKSSKKQNRPKLRRIVGDSMHPTLKPGKLVLFTKARQPKVGDVVMVRHNGMEKIKRITEIRGDEIFLVGDNVASSTDSRHFGWVKRDEIVGKLRWPIV